MQPALHGAVKAGGQTHPGLNRRAGLDAAAAALAERLMAERAAHRLAMEEEPLRAEDVSSQAAIGRALIERGVPTPRTPGA